MSDDQSSGTVPCREARPRSRRRSPICGERSSTSTRPVGGCTRPKAVLPSRSRSSAWAVATPGACSSPEELWELLAAGRDAVSELPGDRGWDIQALPPAVPEDPTATFEGGFIDAWATSTPSSSGSTRAEARLMDPQQRLLLETTWEACEYARNRSRRAPRKRHRGVYRHRHVSLTEPGCSGPCPRVAEGYCTLGNAGEHDLRPAGACAEARGTRDHRRHGLLLLIRGAAPRLPVAAPGRVLDGARGGRRDHRHTLDVHRIRPAD